MIRRVLTFPDPMLKQPAVPVRELGAEALAVAADLLDTMAAHDRCVGLAAPQIGESLRMIAVDVSSHPRAQASHGRLLIVNPVITARAGAEMGREGCLSLPDITANVRRAKRIAFRGMFPDGTLFESLTLGFEARAVQHEIDHLDGILLLDRAASPKEIFARVPR